MHTIIGLGNPGDKYELSRHNVGFMAVDYLAGKLAGFRATSHKNEKKVVNLFENSKKNQAQIYKSEKFLLIKPQTFMNNSGLAAVSVQKYYDLDFSSLYVIHDDLDIEVGDYKIQFGKGPQIHNGLLSLYQHLNTHDFWHVRIGVDGRAGRRDVAATDYVLGQFLLDEKEKIDQVIVEVAQKLLSLD